MSPILEVMELRLVLIGRVVALQHQTSDFFGLTGLIWIDWISVAGVVVTVVGFVLSYVALSRTITADRAVDQSVNRINSDLAKERLEDLLPTYRKQYNSCSAAVDANDAAKLRNTLEKWLSNSERTPPMLDRLNADAELSRRRRIKRNYTEDYTL